MPPWRPGPDVATPDLPRPLKQDLLGWLPAGCYFLQLVLDDIEDIEVDGTIGYDGTLRVDQEGAASGDLYLHRKVDTPPAAAPPWKDRDPASGIPIFPRDFYRYYLRVIERPGASNSKLAKEALRLDFGLYRFDGNQQCWDFETNLWAKLRETQPPGTVRYPRRSEKPEPPFFSGKLFNKQDVPVGKISLRWVSEFLRKAKVQIDTQGDVRPPLCRCGSNSGKTGQHGEGCVSWQEAYRETGWKIDIRSRSFSNGPESWSRTQLHERMLKLRGDPDTLDSEWRSHLLCITRKDRGLAEMYDRRGDDLNGVPREGAALGAHFRFREEDLIWGDACGSMVMENPEVYFHIAVHEIAHTQGLAHNSGAPGFMKCLDHSAAAIHQAGHKFPKGLDFYFSPQDCQRLRHFPDPWVRPGGVPFRHNFSQSMAHLEDHREAPPHLTLKAEPLSFTLPLGAPLRLTIELEAMEPVTWAPRSMNLRSEEVFGRVIDPSGTSRSFMTMVRDLDSGLSPQMEAGEKRRYDMTLLRGAQGALLPSPGLYKVEVSVEWNSSDKGWRSFRIDARTSVHVMPPESREQAVVALKILDEPETLPLLVLGTDLTGKGQAALDKALANAVLRPHFGIVEAGRQAELLESEESGGNPDPHWLKKLEKAIDLIEPTTVLTTQEVEYGLEILRRVPRNKLLTGTFGRVLGLLYSRAVERQVQEQTLRDLIELIQETVGLYFQEEE